MWKLIFKKEIIELLRDRKTLFFMIALPILIFPLIFGGVAYLFSETLTEAKEKTLNFTVINAAPDNQLVAKIAAIENLDLVTLEQVPDGQDEIKRLIDSGDIDFVVELPDDYASNVLDAGQVNVKLFVNSAQLNFARERLDEVVQEVSDQRQSSAFQSLGVSETIQEGLIKPIAIERINVADERESIGASIGGMIPYILFLLCLQGAMIPAADIGAGEKERGTLETLLTSPATRLDIVMGKFLTLCTAGVISALVTVLSVALWTVVLGQGMAFSNVGDFMASIGIVDFLLVFLMLVPIVAIFASVLLALSIYARSYKEAQGYMSPLVFIVIVPVIIALLPGIELKGIYAWVPLTNVALAIKELVKGTMDYFQLLAIFGSSVILAGALLYFCIYWFSKEKVLFR